MRAFAGSLLAVSLLAACGGPTPRATLSQIPAPAAGYTAVGGSADFYTRRALPNESFARAFDGEDCREHIAKVVCLTDRSPDAGQTPECRAGTDAYVAAFQNLYDNYPPQLGRMFCSLTRLLVLDHFGATAYASTIQDDTGRTIGAEMGIRRTVLDEKLDLATWATWKEELSFGGVYGSYTQTLGLPYIKTSTRVPTNDFLYAVVTHEFGHFFDFANNLNATAADGKTFVDGSWGSLSWTSTETVKEEQRFPYRRGLCFYGCDGEPMSRAAAPELYRGLAGSNFISTYAATNPWDDLAETFFYDTMDRMVGLGYELHTGQGESYDMVYKMRSPLMATKRQYVRDFFARPTLAYP